MISNVYYAGATGAYTDAGAQGLRIASFDFPKPQVKTTYVDVPGRNGLIDLSESLTGRPTYQNINGSITFIVLKGASFNLKTFVNTYHGKIMRIYTDEDSSHYYIGRATVTNITLKLGKLRTFTLALNAEPFLWSTSDTNKTFSIYTGSTTGFTTSTSSNMASGYPSIGTKKISLKAASASGGSASFTVSIDASKLYVLACIMDDDADYYTVTTGLGTFTGTQLIKPASGDTTATVTLYTKATTNVADFDQIRLIAMTEVQRETDAAGTSATYFTAPRACKLYVAANANARQLTEYIMEANTPVYTPDIDVLKQDSGGQTGIYVALGASTANDTARLWYTKGMLA